MDITTQFYQTCLDNAWDAAPDGANTLRQQFRVYEQQLTPLSASGSISSVSKNSTNQTYRGAGVGSYTNLQIMSVWRDLINLYDRAVIWANNLQAQAVSWFVKAWPNYGVPGNDNDPTFYQLMKSKLIVVDEYQTDLTDLRIQPTAYGGEFLPPNACW